MRDKDNKNDRRSLRYFYVTPLQYKGSGSYENLDALSINISHGGIFFQSNHDFPVGHKFTMQFKVPGNSEIHEAICEVVHRSEAEEGDGFAIGCKINEIKDMTTEKFKAELAEVFGKDPDRLY